VDRTDRIVGIDDESAGGAAKEAREAMSEHRTRSTVQSLKRAMLAAVQENEASTQLREYRSEPFTVFAVQVEDWEDAEWEVGRLFALLAQPLGINLSFLDTVKDWDNAPDEIYELYAALCPIDVGGFGEPESDYLVIKSKDPGEDISGIIHRGDWVAVLPEMGLVAFPDAAFRAMFSANRAKR
jgi:hypothetical protein